MLSLSVLKALVKPVSELVKALSDGKISPEERDELVLQFSISVAQIVDEVLKSKQK